MGGGTNEGEEEMGEVMEEKKNRCGVCTSNPSYKSPFLALWPVLSTVRTVAR